LTDPQHLLPPQTLRAPSKKPDLGPDNNRPPQGA